MAVPVKLKDIVMDCHADFSMKPPINKGNRIMSYPNLSSEFPYRMVKILKCIHS